MAGGDEANSRNQHVDEEEEAGRNAILRVVTMVVVPYALKTGVELGVPKILVDAGLDKMLTVTEIADKIKVTVNGNRPDLENLGRILRLLACHELLEETIVENSRAGTVEWRYGATAATKYFVADDDKNLTKASKQESYVELFKTLLSLVDTFGSVYKCVLDKTKEAILLVRGKSLFEYFAGSPVEGAQFNKAMANCTAITSRLLLERYEGFKSVKTLVDVGGGVGTNIAAVIAKHPHIRGINFDLPQVIERSQQFPGVEYVSGSFLERIPDCDAVFMKYILHDWSDAICITILETIYKALPEDGKIINVDAVLPEELDFSVTSETSFSSDFVMMALCTGGRERTLSEFRKLGAAAGFHRMVVAGTLDNLSILEFFKK